MKSKLGKAFGPKAAKLYESVNFHVNVSINCLPGLVHNENQRNTR